MPTTGARPMRPPSTPPSSSSSSLINTMMIMLLLFSSSSFVNVVLVGAQEEGASESLLKFKSSLANADPTLADWDSSKSTPCSGNQGNWVGVLCFNGYVWGLQLENMGLKGQIDVNSLTSLRFLRTLSFMNNGFEGMMPDWRKLGALKSLYLSNNQFSGQIPEDAFKGMTSLKKVHLANNKFTGPIPTSLESPKLIELRLENNQFTGPIPALISSDNLKVLNVSNNQLDGPIPADLSNMDPSSFSGNKGLCGKPLGSECNPPIPPPDLEPSLVPPPASTSTTPADAANPNEIKSSTSPGKIAIIIISIVLALFLLMLLILLYRRSRQSQTPQLGREMPPAVVSDETAAASVSSVKKQQVEQQAAAAAAAAGTKLSFVRDDRQRFDLQDLMRASAEVLGSGNFGASYKAVLVDGEALVVKRFKQMSNVAKEDFHEHMRRIGRLKHPNLLPLVAYLYRKEEKLLVFDYIHNGSLVSHLHGKHSPEQGGLNWGKRLKIIKGVGKGLMYLHGELPTLTVPHGHLKSANVLLDNDFNPLLMDYSLLPVVNPTQVQQILVAYRSPEYTKTGRVGKKTDVWCLGVLILEILTGKFVAEYGADWINAIDGSDQNVFDKEMEIGSKSSLESVETLLKIGVDCCREDADERLELEEAIRRIEQVQEDPSVGTTTSII